MSIHGLHVGFLCCQVFVNGHLATARFVQNAHLYAITKRGFAVHHDDVHVLQETIISHIVVGNVVFDVLNTTIVAQRHIVQTCVENARMFVDATRKGEGFLELAQLAMP